MSEEAKAATDEERFDWAEAAHDGIRQVGGNRDAVRPRFVVEALERVLALDARIDAEVRARKAAEERLANPAYIVGEQRERIAALEAELAEAKAREEKSERLRGYYHDHRIVMRHGADPDLDRPPTEQELREALRAFEETKEGAS